MLSAWPALATNRGKERETQFHVSRNSFFRKEDQQMESWRQRNRMTFAQHMRTWSCMKEDLQENVRNRRGGKEISCGALKRKYLSLGMNNCIPSRTNCHLFEFLEDTWYFWNEMSESNAEHVKHVFAKSWLMEPGSRRSSDYFVNFDPRFRSLTRSLNISFLNRKKLKFDWWSPMIGRPFYGY